MSVSETLEGLGGAQDDAPASAGETSGSVPFQRAVMQAIARHRVWAAVTAALFLGLAVMAVGGYFFNWTWTGFEGNTIWDWLSLLITPVTIGAVSIAFTIQQSQRSLADNERQRQTTLQIAEVRQQEAALETCLDHLSHLMLERGLKESPPDSPVRELARARTLATLQRVSPSRKQIILRFLDESGLIGRDAPIVDLTGADLGESGAP